MTFLGMVMLDVSKKKLHQPLASKLIGVKGNRSQRSPLVSFRSRRDISSFCCGSFALMSPNFRKMLGVLLKLRPCKVAKVCVPHGGLHVTTELTGLHPFRSMGHAKTNSTRKLESYTLQSHQGDFWEEPPNRQTTLVKYFTMVNLHFRISPIF